MCCCQQADCRVVASSIYGSCPSADFGRGKKPLHAPWGGGMVACRAALATMLQDYSWVDEVDDGANKALEEQPAPKCCCDTEREPKGGMVCEYVNAGGGACPRLDLGRGYSQLHSAPRGARCQLSWPQLIPARARSDERRSCEAREQLDSTVFPTETHGSYAIRVAAPGVPGLGDLYIAMEEIQPVRGTFDLVIQRTGDSTFSFEIKGDDNGRAAFSVYLKNLILKMPESSLASFAKHWSNVENVISRVVTLGAAGEHYASLKNTPVRLNLAMSGEFKAVDGRWKIIPETKKQYAKPIVKSGGMMLWIVNTVIDNLGGIDALITDLVWPVLEELVPTRFHEAFEKVPHKSGKVQHEFHVSLVCPSEVDDMCPDSKVNLVVESHSVLRAVPKIVIGEFVKLDSFRSIPFLKGMYESMLAAYDEGKQVLHGATGKFQAQLKLDEDALTVAVFPKFQTPIHVFNALAPGFPLENFVGAYKTTQVGGSLSLEGGKVSLRDMRVADLVLPVGAGDGAIEIDATIEEASLVMEEDESGAEDLIFSSSSPISVKVPHMELGVDSTHGAKFDMVHELDAIFATVAYQYIRGLVDPLGAMLLSPASVRDPSLSALEPDGPVPDKFSRPFAAPKQAPELARILKTVQGNVVIEFDNTQVPEADGDEYFELRIDSKWGAELDLGSFLLKQFSQLQDVDFGYMHKVVPGFFGQVTDGSAPPTRRAVARLSCGTLSVYGAQAGPKSEPFKTALASVDLRSRGDLEMLRVRMAAGSEQDMLCFKVGTGSYMYTYAYINFFCAPREAMAELDEAIVLQGRRIMSAGLRWRSSAACSPGLNGTEPQCRGNPDGTWFERFDPFNAKTWFPNKPPPATWIEVNSPRAQWDEATSDSPGA